MAQGRTIRIYLVDGEPSGILTAEIINWTGKVLVASRTQLSLLAKREEVRRTGVYCIIGPDPENSNREIVYIGEGDNVIKRLTDHDKDESKDFWTRCIVVISKDQNITKSHGRYLESRLISMGHQAGRAKIHNGTAPPPPSLPEPDIADMEYFISQLQMIFPVLGFGFLQPKAVATIAPDPKDESDSPLFCLNLVGAEAKAREIGDSFVVLKGSTARKQGPKVWTSYKTLRDQLLADGKLVDSDHPDFYVFADDVEFSSPSAGAACVNAGNSNGRTNWKVADTGETYQQWHDQKLRAAKSTPAHFEE
jgi:hypothetical protein